MVDREKVIGKMNNTSVSPAITILGAGLVGCLLGIYLKKRGQAVTIYEKRTDPRISKATQGRSINLALSDRGLAALAHIGLDQEILRHAVAMNGRMVHTLEGNTNFQPYHHEGKTIYSISRAALNLLLLQTAEQYDIPVHFDHACKQVDFKNNQITLTNQGKVFQEKYEYLFGADGAYSALRQSMQDHQGFNFSQQYLDYGYKEFHIPKSNENTLDLNVLHIWPRHDFMLIALPNNDGSYTATLFLRLKGKNSFESINSRSEVTQFFTQFFKDVYPMIENADDTFLQSATGSMVTIQTNPWVWHENTCLLGDAAHAIVPFYGQGMNAGFESVRLLCEALDTNNNFITTIKDFASHRILNTNAIATLAANNFIEMRDLVANERFLFRKKIESWLLQHFPAQFQTVYSLVTFSTMPYAGALKQAEKQQKMFDEMMAEEQISKNWESDEAKNRVEVIFYKYFPKD